MKVPDNVRDGLKARLWAIADRVGWTTLSAPQKSKYYHDWAQDPNLGGVLLKFMDAPRLRQYFKDTLIKDYVRHRLADHTRAFRVLRIQDDCPVAETYIKPHGKRLADGRVICWGPADEWKLVIMAVFERAYGNKEATPYAALLLQPCGRFNEDAVRQMVQSAATKLGIERLVWLDR